MYVAPCFSCLELVGKWSEPSFASSDHFYTLCAYIALWTVDSMGHLSLMLLFYSCGVYTGYSGLGEQSKKKGRKKWQEEKATE